MEFAAFQEQFQIRLNRQQQAAVRAKERAVLLLAVPGSGKTTTLVTRLGYLIHCRSVAPEQLLTMTYTVAATQDMKRRFAALFGPDLAGKLAFRTINGVCALVIRRYEQARNTQAFRLMEQEGQLAALLSELYQRERNEFLAESTRKTIQTGITYIKNQMLSRAEIEAYRPDGVELAPIYFSYCRALRERQWMDYDDQLVYALQILRTCPEILAEFQARYRWIHVDEAQDTSKIQHEIIRLLVGKRGKLFMVGDEDQSIYGFRAAWPQALMEFERRFSGARVLLLGKNYRSTRQIVSAANRFIAGNRNRREKHMTAVRGSGPEVGQIWVYNRMAQYQYLAKVAGGCEREMAVLFRNNESALPVIDLLDRAGIPYRCRQFDSSFFTHRVVQDVTDIIRFAQAPEDGALFLRLYYKLGTCVTKAAAEQAAARSARTGRPVLQVLSQMEEVSAFSQRRCALLQKELEELPQRNGALAVYHIAGPMGYSRYLSERDADPGKLQILQVLGASEPSPQRLLLRLQELAELVRRGAAQTECPFVLSTIHSSKGLEYERVYLADVLDGVLPGNVPGVDATAEERQTYEEERRLFYVGMTRARQQLSVFRFEKPELWSTFAAEVFEAQPENRALKLKKGARVRHRTYGPGIVTDCPEGLLEIRFSSGETKLFSRRVLEEQRLLQPSDRPGSPRKRRSDTG